MTEKEEFGDALLNLLQSPVAKRLTPQERVDVVSMARSAMRVPATIWSPEDFLGWGNDDYIDDMWETFDIDITDAEWDQVAQHATRFTEELEDTDG